MAFKKLTAGLMASSLILGLASTALADITTATPFETASKMNKLGVVMGVGTNPDGSIDFNLGGNLTRAELVTTIVRSFGGEQSAQLAKGAPSFPDVAADAWFSGYVAVAKNIASQRGVTIGRDATHFDPNANVSKAEALVFIMKFLGIKVESSGANWYQAWVARAVELGIIAKGDADIALASPGASATRGEAFVILDFGYSAKVLEGGASLYTAYVDTVKPTVTASAPETTTDAKVTVSGKASDDKGLAAVFVNGKAVVVKDGNFSAEVADLKVGANSIEVSAQDIAGNTFTQTLKVTRTNATATSIEAADIEVAAGAAVAVSAQLLDANKAPIADAKFEGKSDLGTYADGKFTAGKTAGTGKLTLKSGDLTKDINVKVTAGELAGVTADKVSAAVGAKVTLTAVDANGNAISGATFAQDSADAFMSGNAFVATKPGSYKVTATVGGKSADYTVSVFSTTVASYAVKPSATSVVANNASAFTVDIVALDANNNSILSSGTTDDLTFDPTTIANFEVQAGDGSWGNLTTTKLVGGKKTLTLRSISTTGGVTAKIKVTKGLTTSTPPTFDPNIFGSAKVDLVDQVATSLAITAPTTPYIQNNLTLDGSAANNGTVAVKVLDQDGKLMKSGAFAVTVGVSGAGAKLVDDVVDNNPADSKTLFFFGGAANVTTYVRSTYLNSGDITVTASATGLTGGTAKFIAASAFSASKLQVSQDLTTAVANYVDAVTFTVMTTDANGVPNAPVAGHTSATATFDISNTYAPEISYSLDGTTWTALVGTTAGKKVTLDVTSGKTTVMVRSYGKVGDVKVTFSDAATTSALASDAKTITFKADAANNVGMLRVDPIQVAVAQPEVTFSAQLYDGAGNEVKQAGRSITFSTDNTDAKLNGGSNSVTVTTDADGKATVKVAVPAYVDEVTTINVVGAAGEGLTAMVGAGSVDVRVVNQVATSMSYTLVDVFSGLGVSTAKVGDTLHLAVTVKDAAGRAVVGQTLTVVATAGTTAATVVLNDAGGTGVYQGNFQPTSAGRLTLSVKNSSAATEIAIPVAVNVRAAAFSKAAVERTDYTTPGTLSANKGVSTLFRIVPLDTQNNVSPKMTANNVVVTWSQPMIQTGEYFEVRSSETGASVSNVTGFTMAPGTSGQSFFVLTNAANAAVTFTFVEATTGTSYGTDTVTFQAK